MVNDLIIIGGGPAGLTASIYASRHKLSHIVFEGGCPGGQIAIATDVENWPGEKSIRGADLAQRILEQAKAFGMDIHTCTATDIARDDKTGVFTVTSAEGARQAKGILLATGAMHRKLGITGEDKFLGRGLSYCVTCDGPFFKGKNVAIVGGGDAALTGAVYLADIAEKVYIIHRRNEFRAEESNQEKAKSNKKIEFVLTSEVKELKGDTCLRSITVENADTKAQRELPVSGLFVYVGNVPASALSQKIGVATDEKGYIKVDLAMRTNVPGVFAAGDITGAAPQAIIASGQGALAAMSAYKFVKGLKEGIAVVNR